MRIALGLEYDGRHFCGWQSQVSGCGVQDALERALATIAAHPVRTVAAGRTDTGVHATAQVVHFDTEARRPEQAWIRGTNAALPDSVAVLWAKAVPDDFHARFAASGRAYTYLLLDRPVRAGLIHGRVGWCHMPLDVERMARAANALLGTQDFSAFRASECQARSPVRTLRALRIERHADLIVFVAEADGFLHHMMRNIVGSLVYVGAARQPEQWIAELLARRDRTRAAPTFAADGLYLTAVQYDAAWELPAVSRPLLGLCPGVPCSRP